MITQRSKLITVAANVIRQLFVLGSLVLLVQGEPMRAFAEQGELGWTEDFADNPLTVGRFEVPAGHDETRFTYDDAGQFLTVHYDTSLPTAWYMRPIDAGQVLGRCDDFEFCVTFRVRSEGFFADDSSFAQIGWGLINSQTTGEDRAGGSAGPYAFDVVGFDYFPNVSPLFGGPTLGPTVIHTDEGQGFFTNIDFSFGAETRIDQQLGDESIGQEIIYRAKITYNGIDQLATLVIQENSQSVVINADGAGGIGGFDGDTATIQTFLQIDAPFQVDTFALTAWQDTFNPFGSSVIADIDVLEIIVSARLDMMGDFNGDGLVDGEDIGPFTETLLTEESNVCLVTRADFNKDDMATCADIDGFLSALLAD